MAKAGMIATMPRKMAPGSVIRVKVSSVNEEGLAVGRYRGFTVVVRGAEPGTTVEAVVERVAGRTVYARAAP